MMNHLRKSIRGKAGFTLLEVLVVMLIFGLVISTVSTIYLSNIKTLQISEKQEELQQNLRVALDAITSEIRQAPGNTIEIANSVSGTNQEIVFVDTYSLLEEKRFAIVDGQLKRLGMSPPGVGSYVYEPITTQDLNIVALNIYENTIGVKRIFNVYLKGRMTGNDGQVMEMEQRTQVVSRLD